MYAIESEIVSELYHWLGAEGRGFFRKVKNTFGTVDAVIPANHEMNPLPIPHPIHFREGVQIRNKIRSITQFAWDSHWYDDKWAGFVESAINLPEK